ncbi:response regulator transcription factor [Bacillus daqingensis]|uniref:Response regulator transcription factor n=1 Tax=Bacillus daqingensis TaxID=872396 RepID=A0ABV9NY68_9BACI
MQQSYTPTHTAANGQVLVIDHDRYLTGNSEKRLQETLPGERVIVEQGDVQSFDDASHVFLLIESLTSETTDWIDDVLERTGDAKVLLVTVGRPSSSLIPYLSNHLSGLLSLHSFYTYGKTIISTVDEFGCYLEQGMHDDLVRHLHEQKLRDRPIKRLVLRQEDVQYQLTKNERAVLQHILDGHNNRKIAELMYLAPSTVSTVISHLLKKLGANDRTDAMVRIIRNGWVDAMR